MMETRAEERVHDKNVLRVNNDRGREECAYLDTYQSPSMRNLTCQG